ncbi:asparagine synthetase B [Siminovitchia acidinfaciens]|uniref:asparagine synthase (glutamine-hydrolyzing) n=1 Tax=Siminovitchia acidinfaciens TaxID=2321395 RepID=A0A429XW06_9BACI|nr:asparagine synthase-related protein [Siminovitchia acidinfaciens]RST72533.1 asparagine synthetase B [Siminovitchia acidinfaciens]
MSAITGLFNHNNQIVDAEHCTRLMGALKKFPSDDKYTWSSNCIFMGCHNQWITKESIGERLPYYDSERQLAITADAMIDNRRELFERLQVKKSLQKTLSDSQLILRAYVKWGKNAPNYLIGDFSFMIWDERNQKLFGARDFSGARTLYYYNNPEQFVFSTLIEPMLTLPFVKRKINEDWLAEFIAIPTIVESADINHTVFEDIYQVPPGHTITIDHGRIRLQRYWYVGPVKTLNLKSESEYQEAFQDVFRLSVTEKMRSHGEVGSHLSGGLDSGSVVSFAAKELKKKMKTLHTYSYIPEETFEDWTPKYYIADERPFIKETVRYVGNVKDNYLDFKSEDPFSGINDFLEIMEMPYKFFENAFWLKGINERAQVDGVKILLNGARGNHSISWGSERLNIEYYASLLKGGRLLQLNQELTAYCANFLTGKKIMLPIVARNAFPKIFRLLSMQNNTKYAFPSFINQQLANRTNVYNKLKQYSIVAGHVDGGLDEYRRSYYDQLHVWNKSGTATTKLSLRYSLWDRDPTNDPRVIRFCLSVPEKQYVKEGMERSFLRRMTKNILPDKVRLNHYSRGIQAADTIHRMKPIWMKFKEEISEICRDSVMADIIDTTVIENILTDLSDQPSLDFVWTDNFKILTRSLMIHRFLKKQHVKGGD